MRGQDHKKTDQQKILRVRVSPCNVWINKLKVRFCELRGESRSTRPFKSIAPINLHNAPKWRGTGVEEQYCV